MELGLWGTLWANCALGTYFALPTLPMTQQQSEELIQHYEDPTHQDHETQTVNFSDSDEEDESVSQDPMSEKEDNEEEVEAEGHVGDRIVDIQNNGSTSDSNSLSSVEKENSKLSLGRKIIIVSKGKKNRAYQRNRYNREEYRCMICPYTCTTERAFLRHLRSHSEAEGKEVSQGNNQDMILRLSCPVCGKDRTGEPALNKHMQRHRDKNKNFCCDICCFKTVQLKKLIQHRRMHTGERPHLCPHCAYRAARRDNLRSHVRRVHKRDNLTGDTFNPRGMLLVPSAKISSPVEIKTEEDEK